MSKVISGIACNLDSNILKAALPLFSDGSVEAIEWSFDALFRHSHIPTWFNELLNTFGNEGRLLGHGVYFSIFSARHTLEQKLWLENLSKTTKQFRFAHISEHFGFMTGEDFHKGAPLNVPISESTLQIAKDRIARMQDASGCAVGLENLAFSYDEKSLRNQGQFLRQILEDVNGFIILDLHNIYCQVHNFGIAFDELLSLYPLDLVREVHISGGSWEKSKVESSRMIRRDTHDESVPNEVFEYLKQVLDLLPNVRFVILEQLGSSLDSEVEQDRFRADFRKMKKIVKETKRNWQPSNQQEFRPKFPNLNDIPFEDEILASQQSFLSNILETSNNFQEVKSSLEKSILSDSEWMIEEWEDAMLETAFEISQKWKKGFPLESKK